MRPEELQRQAMELFDELCDLAPDERAAALDRKCAGDAALRREVESLVAHDASSAGPVGDGLHGAGAAVLAASMAEDMATEPAAPEWIGRYRVVRRIGQGGMGVVYEAWQENPRRRVAIKVIQPGMATDRIIKRFEYEAQVLGSLQHPGVAHIYEAGYATTNGVGNPFFAMEFVEGRRIDVYAREENLSTCQRLELMARVADAVQHAHQKGVLHRDLKPANVLVVRERSTILSAGRSASGKVIDEIGQPKVLDFGVARAIDDPGDGVTRTEIGQVLGTLSYMSPEQIAGDPAMVDTRADVYALGAMLHQLMSGSPPFDVHDKGFGEAARIISESDPPRLGETAPWLRGDIETIVRKAMDKDRERRYASAAEFAADILLHLRNEPILARPASALYLMRRFAHRNRPLVAGAAAAVIALAAGVAAMYAGLVAARSERDAKVAALGEAQSAREVSEAVTDFFAGILSSANPGAQGRDVTVRDALDRAGEDIAERFGARPTVEAAIRSALGRTYTSLGAYDRAAEHAAAAVRVWEAHVEPTDRRLLEALAALGEALYFQGRRQAANAALEDVLARSESALGPDDPALVSALADAAFIANRLGRFDLAEARFLRALAILAEAPEQDALQLAELQGNYAQSLAMHGRSDEAVRLYHEALALASGSLGEDHPHTILLRSNLAWVYKETGKPADAAALLREALASQERTLGPNHSKTLITLNNLADSLGLLGEFTDAEELLNIGFERAAAEEGPEGPSMAFMLLTLGRVRQAAGRLEEAEEALRQSAVVTERLHGAASEPTASAQFNLIRLLLLRANHEEAARVAAATVERAIATVGEAHPRVIAGRLLLSEAHSGMGQQAEAESVLLAAHRAAPERDRSRIAAALARHYERIGRSEDAERWMDGQ